MCRFSLTTFILMVLMAFVLPDSACATIPQPEREALKAIYLATGGDGWTSNTNWCAGVCPVSGVPTFNAPGTECTWHRVVCDSDQAHVQKIVLNENQLTGRIPSLEQLTQLQSVYLFGNDLTGTVPDITSLTELYEIDLSSNRLSGPVPDFSGMVNLGIVNLSNNQFSGPLASPVATPQLQDFDVSSNQLTGPIPNFPGVYWLEDLNVSHNHFTGPVPDLSHTNIVMFYADHNLLTGTLPPPSPSMSLRYFVRLCPNPLDLTSTPYDQDWDFTVGQSPWWGPADGGCDLLFTDMFGE
jgi:hypothetical protein